MLSINTNLSSLIAQSSMKSSTNALNQAIERMTTGLKINHASDNAANYSISTNLTTKIGAYQIAEENVAMGLDMLATASENLELIGDKLQHLRALAIQANNGTYGEKSLKAINSEANAIVDEINRLYKTTEYNQKKLLQSETESLILPNGKDLTPKYSGFIEKAKEYSESDILQMTSLTEAYKIGTFISGNKYSISTAEELAMLAEMTNNGVETSGVVFVLANDIDLKEWCQKTSLDGSWIPIGNDVNKFCGIFNGNGNVIKNLVIDKYANANYQGLFGYISNAKILNVGIEDATIKANNHVGGICGYATSDSIIKNTYYCGTVDGYYNVGGISGSNNSGCLSSYIIDSVITGVEHVGGICGYLNRNTIISNSFVKAEINAISSKAGGLIGTMQAYGTCINKLENNIVNATINCDIKSGAMCGGIIITNNGSQEGDVIIENCKVVSNKSDIGTFLDIISGITTEVFNPDLKTKYLENIYIPTSVSNYSLQVGVNQTNSSSIQVNLMVHLEKFINLYRININEPEYLQIIDELGETISAKQTDLGAAQNRLMSALDEISTQYENLVSTRSTIRDADIAEVSSTYIQQQILQQAAATLMATANQTPAIALQLI